MSEDDAPNFREICDRSCIDCFSFLEVADGPFVVHYCDEYKFIMRGSAKIYVCDSWLEQ